MMGRRKGESTRGPMHPRWPEPPWPVPQQRRSARRGGHGCQVSSPSVVRCHERWPAQRHGGVPRFWGRRWCRRFGPPCRALLACTTEAKPLRPRQAMLRAWLGFVGIRTRQWPWRATPGCPVEPCLGAVGCPSRFVVVDATSAAGFMAHCAFQGVAPTRFVSGCLGHGAQRAALDGQVAWNVVGEQSTGAQSLG